jgi:hypothetical protein
MGTALWVVTLAVLFLPTRGRASLTKQQPHNVRADARLTSCFLDGLWYGAGPDGATVTVGIQSQLGPPGSTTVDTTASGLPHRRSIPSPPGFAVIPGAAIACVPGVGCLDDTSGTHGCIAVGGNQTDKQCAWTRGPSAAAEECGRWDACGGFWCGADNNTAGSNASWCWARSVHATMSYTSPDALDTAYVKAPNIPPLEPGTVDLVGASCQSQQCAWTFASGAWYEDGSFNLTRSDGVVDSGIILNECNDILWSNGGTFSTWTKLNANISKVHIVFMAHYDAG